MREILNVAVITSVISQTMITESMEQVNSKIKKTTSGKDFWKRKVLSLTEKIGIFPFRNLLTVRWGTSHWE
jgi:hypothetical protein